jgi:hypothetical protein
MLVMTRLVIGLQVLACVVLAVSASIADEREGASSSIDQQRLELMTRRVESISISSSAGTAEKLSPTPLFRYDDQTRGYVDGTVWKWGDKGRPRAIVTAELHPNYLNSGPRVVYDLLSLSDDPFFMKSPDITWSPRASAVAMTELPDAPVTAETPAQRLTQFKKEARRFSATQDIQELTTTHVSLRLLPREIDRYVPGKADKADGVLFLFVNGRNPSIVLLLETDGTKWSYGAGRLSLPSTLELMLDGTAVWSRPKSPAYDGTSSYTAMNSAAEIP